MERNCTGGVEVTQRQMADIAFRFDGTEWNGNVTVFMPHTVLIELDIVFVPSFKPVDTSLDILGATNCIPEPKGPLSPPWTYLWGTSCNIRLIFTI